MTLADIASASYAGVVAGAVIAILWTVGRTRGLLANSEMMMGTILVSRSASHAWLAGAGMSVAASGLAGVAYALGFEYVTRRTGIGAGALLALLHTVMSGLALAALPAVHPQMRQLIAPPPGIFKSNLGTLDAGAFVLFRVIFGALVGYLYHPMTMSIQQASDQ
jgi:hypothetical protein